MSFLLVCLVSYTRTVLPTSCVGAVRPASKVVLQQLVCPCGTGSSHQPHCGLMKEHLNNTNSCHYQVFIIISTWLNTHLSSPQILSQAPMSVHVLPTSSSALLQLFPNTLYSCLFLAMNSLKQLCMHNIYNSTKLNIN